MIRALDLACGEGNDLNRWKDIDRKLGGRLRLVGVDIDRCAVFEARRRAKLPANRGLHAQVLQRAA